MKQLYLLVTLVACCALSAKAQEVTNIVPSQMEDGRVKISYTLKGAYPDQMFSVKLYSSFNGFAKALEHVTGDANKDNITPGNKEIIWDAAKEITAFEGELVFRVIATPVSDYSVLYPTEGEKFKKGETMPIKWDGFNPQTSLRLELYKGNRSTKEITRTAQGYSYNWDINQAVRPGKYSLRVSKAQNPKEFAQSGVFTIRRKVPIAITISGAALVSGAVAWYLTRPEDVEPLPEPPQPPANE